MYTLSQKHFCEAGPTSYMERPHFHMHASPEHYSRLERITQQMAYDRPVAYAIRESRNQSYALPVLPVVPMRYAPESTFASYTASSSAYTFITPTHAEYHFSPADFLKPGKEGRFVGRAEEIRAYILEAFEKIFEMPFPNNIIIAVCSEKEFRKLAPHPGTMGLSVNRGREGQISEIFVLNDTLARVLLTIGHELGHVLTSALDNPHDEEAKAYAFSLVWMWVIKEHNIAGLAGAIVTEMPAENGLHNVAFAFVERMLRKGMEVWRLYVELVRKNISVLSFGDFLNPI